MKANHPDFLMRKDIYVLVAAATVALLLIPFLLMTFRIPLPDPGSPSVGGDILRWDLTDFTAMGLLLFAAGSLFVTLGRKLRGAGRLLIGLLILLGLLYAWAELAVGVFTSLGS